MLTDLGEQVLDRLDILIGRRLHGETAVVDLLLHLLCVVVGHSTVFSQIALASDNHDEHLVLALVLDVICPLSQLIVAALIINGIAEDSDLGTVAEHVRQVMDLLVTSRVPNVQRQLVIVTCLVLNIDDLGVVLDGVRAILLLALYGGFAEERVYDGGLPDVCVAHEDHLGSLLALQLGRGDCTTVLAFLGCQE